MCPFALILFELQANMDHVNEMQIDALEKSLHAVSLVSAVWALMGNASLMEFEKRTPVKIIRGSMSGKVGTIAGTLDDREGAITKAIVRIDDNGVPEWAVIQIDCLRELTQMEMIVLGFK